MARPIANVPSVRSTVSGFTVGAGLKFPVSTTSYTSGNVPLDNATALLGIDAIPFLIPPGGVFEKTFPNLPVRTNRANPLAENQASQPKFTVLPQDTLIMMVTQQGSDAAVAMSSYGIIRNNIKVPGPFLGSETYSGFGVRITGTLGNKGIVVAMLLLQRGI